jgi:hypothetical protein
MTPFGVFSALPPTYLFDMVDNYHLQSMAGDEAVYYTAYHFGVAGEGVGTPQKDLIHDKSRVGSPAYMELGTVTGSATLLHFGDAGRKLGLTATGGLQMFKEWKGNSFDCGADSWISALLCCL